MKIQSTFYLILVLFFSCDLEPFPEEGVNCALDGIPEAKISVNTNNCSVSDCTITFDASQSSNACSYKWDLDGNISTIEKEGVSIQHIFTQIGMITVTLRIENSNGEMDTEEIIINVNSGQVMSLFEVASSTNNSYAPSIVNFTNLSTNGDSYEWNFGDPTSGNENTSTEENTSHLYANPGIYSVELRVENSNSGIEDVYEKDVIIENVITFEKFYGGVGTEYGNSIIETQDGGFAIVGSTASIGNGESDIYLILTDSNGNEKPNSGKTYGGLGVERGNSIIETQDGGFAIIGETTSIGNGGYDIYLILTDSNGNEKPSSGKTYGGLGFEFGTSIIETQDGGFAIVGSTRSFGNGDYDIYLILTDSNGNEKPSSGKTYGGLGVEFGGSIIETQDGGFAIVGNTRSFGNGESDIYLILTDLNGNEKPSSGKTYGGLGVEFDGSIIETQDGEFAIVGNTASIGNGESDIYLILTDSNGNELPSSGKTYGGMGEEWGRSIIKMGDGGFAIVGRTKSFGNGLDDIYLILIDSNGIEKSNSGKTYGDSNSDEGKLIIETQDGGYAIVGSTRSFGNGDTDVYFIKTDANGNL